MKLHLGTKIGFLLSLSLLGAVLSVSSFHYFRARAAFVLPVTNIAAHQRKVAEQLSAWAHMVGEGQDEDRAGLRELVAQFDHTLSTLASGGKVGKVEVPAPRPELGEAIASCQAEWGEWRPRLLLVADQPMSDPEARAAKTWLATRAGRLAEAADGIVQALAAWTRDEGQRQSHAFAGIVGLNGFIFFAGLWLMRRSVVRPVLAMAEAARRMRAGDYSQRIASIAADEIGTLAGAFNEMSAEVSRLLESEIRFTEVVEHATDGVVLTGADGKVTYFNAAAEKIFGWNRQEVCGHPLELIIPERSRAAHAAGLARRLAGGVQGSMRVPLHLEGLRKDGTTFPIDVTVSWRVGRQGMLFTGIVRDATERTQLAARMMQMDRMLAVGTLAAGVGHEINNPLAFVIGNLGFLAEELTAFERDSMTSDAQWRASIPARLAEVQQALKEALEGAERVKVIVRDLKTLSRADEDSRGLVDVAQVMDLAAKMANNELRHRARLVKQLNPVPPVLANQSRLGQVFLNLLVNAAQALPDGTAEANQITVRTSVDGARVVTEVCDTGCGIPRENLARIFDPFFTTKPIGQGTGLGLSICQGIVRNLGGEIQVESTVGKGSIFRVVLPAASADAAEEPPAPAPAPAPAQR
ncbi:MAG: ATP-binding protein, partial [Myxococcaceae bacterium]